MLTFEQAKRIGLDACIDRLGRDFFMKYRDASCPGYGDMEDRAYCFMGVDNREVGHDEEKLILTSNNPFPYIASCTVRYSDGAIEFLQYVTPEQDMTTSIYKSERRTNGNPSITPIIKCYNEDSDF